jgi:4-hydroxy-3-polyprenylbenzoate decarboxylase
MLVVPATSSFVAGVSAGLSKDLVQRAALVTLKERRRLVIVFRETPVTRVMLQQLISLDEMGSIILPASPGFYQGYSSVRELVDSVAGKVLDVAGIDHVSERRWVGRLSRYSVRAREEIDPALRESVARVGDHGPSDQVGGHPIARADGSIEM